MIKLLPILFSVVINIANVNIFEIEGIFSSGHINALNRYAEEIKVDEQNLFIVQYNASDINSSSVEDLQVALKNINTTKAIWVGPNKREVKMSILKNFDFVGLSPGTVVTTDEGVNALEVFVNLILVQGQIY